MSENHSQFIIYQTEEGETKLDVRFENETVWLTQKLMAELFSTTPENILMHLKNIYQEDELNEKATTKDFLVVRQEGTRQVKRNLKHYNLDAIISVGYRVQSHTATRFRQWATRHFSRSHAPAWECIRCHTILTYLIWIPTKDLESQSIAENMS